MELRGPVLDEREPTATRWSVGRTATVDVVVPVYNEERALPGCLQVLRRHLRDQFPFEWTITVVDNASTDGVLRVASEIAASDDRVRVLHLDRKGRGHACAPPGPTATPTSWSTSTSTCPPAWMRYYRWWSR